MTFRSSGALALALLGGCTLTVGEGGGTSGHGGSNTTSGTTSGGSSTGSCSPFGAACPEGQYCNYTLADCDGGAHTVVAGTCLTPLASGVACANDAQCAFGELCSGTCQDSTWTCRCPSGAIGNDAGVCSLAGGLPASVPHAECPECSDGCMFAACPGANFGGSSTSTTTGGSQTTSGGTAGQTSGTSTSSCLPEGSPCGLPDGGRLTCCLQDCGGTGNSFSYCGTT